MPLKKKNIYKAKMRTATKHKNKSNHDQPLPPSTKHITMKKRRNKKNSANTAQKTKHL